MFVGTHQSQNWHEACAEDATKNSAVSSSLGVALTEAVKCSAAAGAKRATSNSSATDKFLIQTKSKSNNNHKLIRWRPQ